MRGGKTDHKRVKALNATLDAKLDAYERILAKQKYLAGNVSPPAPLCTEVLEAASDELLTNLLFAGRHARGLVPLTVRDDGNKGERHHWLIWKGVYDAFFVAETGV